MYKLFINGVECEGLDSKTLVLNKTTFTLSELETRGIEISNNIILPRTGINNKIFNILSDNKFDIIYNAKLYENSALILEGDFIVKQISNSSIKIQLRQESKSFFNSLNSNLHELDLQAYDFNFTRTNYDLLKDATTNNFWLWTGTDYRNRKITNPGNFFTTAIGLTRLEISRPMFRAWEILTKIIEDKGYVADLTELDPLPQLLLSSNAKRFYFTDYQDLFTNVVLTSGTELTFLTGNERSPVNFYTNPTATTIQNKFIPCRYGLKGTINTNDIVIMSIENINISTGSNDVIEYVIEDGIINILTDSFDVDTILSISFSQDITINSLRFTGLNNETDYYFATGVTWTNGDITVNGWDRTTSGSLNIPILQDYLIPTSYNLPEWTQIEFITELWKMFFLDFEVKNNIVKVTFNNSIKKRNAIEFRKITNDPEDELYDIFNQTNLFKYTNDETLQSNYGQKRINKNNDRLDAEEKNLITLNTSASLESLVTDYGTITFKTGNLPVYTVSSPANTNSEDRAELTDRFLLYTTNINSSLIPVIGSQSYFSSTSNFTIIPNDPNLSFDDLYNKYYSFIYDNIQSNSRIKLQVNINFIEYVNLLKYKTVYYKNKYYLVLSINKYNPLNLTEIDLIGF